jgi:hypothetical protein
LLGDEGYLLLPCLMTWYSATNLDVKKLVFNSKLSRAQRSGECVFGIMCAKWKNLSKGIKIDQHNAISFVKDIKILHYFLLKHMGPDSNYLSRETKQVKFWWAQHCSATHTQKVSEAFWIILIMWHLSHGNIIILCWKIFYNTIICPHFTTP